MLLLLLGTDNLPQLVFALLDVDLGEAGIDLLQKQTWKMQPGGGESVMIVSSLRIMTTGRISESGNCSSLYRVKPSYSSPGTVATI